MNVTKNNEPLLLEYSEMQDHVFGELPLSHRFIVLAKGRRAGGTVGAIQYLIEKSIDNPVSILWVDTIQQNLIPLFHRYFHPILSQFKPQFYSYRKQTHELDLFSSQIYFRSAERPESLEGFYFDICVLNEAGLILRGSRGRTLWFNSVLPMLLDRSGSCFIIGTPKGMRNKKNEESKTSLFFELYQKGQPGSGTYSPDWASRTYDSYCNIEMLARQIMIGERNRGVELTLAQAKQKAVADLNQLALDYPYHIRAQEIYGEFIDRQEESIFHEHWFDIVDELPDIRLRKQTIISMDTAFKIGASNDYSAAIVIMQTVDNHYYIVDIMNEKYEFPQLLQATKDFYLTHEDARFMLIEDKASGIPLIQTLRQETEIPIKAIKVSVDKLTRASACCPLFEQGRVHLVRAGWNTLYITQHCQFNGLFDSDDDLIDCTSQGLNFLTQSAGPRQNPVTRKVVRSSTPLLRGYGTTSLRGYK